MRKSPAATGFYGTIPATLTQPGVGKFWLVVLLTGLGAGISAAVLTLILQFVQTVMWPSAGGSLLDAARQADPLRHVLVLTMAGFLDWNRTTPARPPDQRQRHRYDRGDLVQCRAVAGSSHPG